MHVVDPGIILTMVSVLWIQRVTCFLDPQSVKVHVFEGRQAVLACPITNRIPMWQRPTGGKLTEYEQANYTVPGVPKAIRERLSVNLNKLILDNAQVSDAGTYKCSYPGHGSGYVSLQVDVPLTATSTATITASSTSTTSSSSTTSSTTATTVSSSTTDSTTTTTPVLSKSLMSVSLTPTTHPRPTFSGSYVHFYEGQTVTLTCSLPTKVVPSWVHPDNETINFQGFAFVSPLFKYKDKYRYTVLQNGSLMINATKASDAGSYVCVSGTEKETLHLLIAVQSTTKMPLESTTNTQVTTETPHIPVTNMTTHVSPRSTYKDLSSTASTFSTAEHTSASSTLTSAVASTSKPFSPPTSTHTDRCETCSITDGLTCKSPSTITCPADIPYCMNHITSVLGRKYVEKRCASQVDCYMKYWIGFHSECYNIFNATGPLDCYFCCEQALSKSLPCNHHLIPSEPAVFFETRAPKTTLASSSTATPDKTLSSSAETKSSRHAQFLTSRSITLAKSSSTIVSTASKSHSAEQSTYVTPVSNTSVPSSSSRNLTTIGSVTGTALPSSTTLANISGLTTKISNNSMSRSHMTPVLFTQSPFSKNHTFIVSSRANFSSKAATSSAMTQARNHTDQMSYSTTTPASSSIMPTQNYTGTLSLSTTTHASSINMTTMNHTGAMPNATVTAASSNITAINNTKTMPNITTTPATSSKTTAMHYTGTMPNITTTATSSNTTAMTYPGTMPNITTIPASSSNLTSMNHTGTISYATTAASSNKTTTNNCTATIQKSTTTPAPSNNTTSMNHTGTKPNSRAPPASTSKITTMNHTATMSIVSTTPALSSNATAMNHAGTMPNGTSIIVLPKNTTIMNVTGTMSSTITQTRKHTRIMSNSSSTLTLSAMTTTVNHTRTPSVTSSTLVSSSMTPTLSSRMTPTQNHTKFSNISGHPNTAGGYVNTTKKPMATIPSVQTKCAVCAGPPEACEVAFYEDYCQPPNHYCINHITNMANGKRLVERKCGNVQRCYNEWYLGTSDDDKCRQFSSSRVMTYSFECTYCCVKDGCNVDLHPKEDTLYSNT